MVWTYLLISHTLRDWDVKFNQVLNGGPCMDVGTQKMDSVRQCAPSKPGSSHHRRSWLFIFVPAMVRHE